MYVFPPLFCPSPLPCCEMTKYQIIQAIQSTHPLFSPVDASYRPRCRKQRPTWKTCHSKFSRFLSFSNYSLQLRNGSSYTGFSTHSSVNVPPPGNIPTVPGIVEDGSGGATQSNDLLCFGLSPPIYCEIGSIGWKHTGVSTNKIEHRFYSSTPGLSSAVPGVGEEGTGTE